MRVRQWATVLVQGEDRAVGALLTAMEAQGGGGGQVG